MLRREAVTRAEELQNVGRLADDELPGLEKRRGERRAFDVAAAQKAYERRDTGTFTGLPRDIAIARPGFLESQPDELPSTLNRRPVIELVVHILAILRERRAVVASRVKALSWFNP